jgi:hypothetical protein
LTQSETVGVKGGFGSESVSDQKRQSGLAPAWPWSMIGSAIEGVGMGFPDRAGYRDGVP